MSHTFIDYSPYSESIKHAEAIKDLREWWGNDGYEAILQDFRTVHQRNPMPLSKVEMFLSIAGVEGYPVIAFYKEMCDAS